jgi:hypothetical protein
VARIDGSLCDQSTAGSLTALGRALALEAIFGRSLVCKALEVDPAELDITVDALLAVSSAAAELLERSRDTEAQCRVVERLAPQTRLALCLWMLDLSLGAKLAARAIYASMQVRG